MLKNRGAMACTRPSVTEKALPVAVYRGSLLKLEAQKKRKKP